MYNLRNLCMPITSTQDIPFSVPKFFVGPGPLGKLDSIQFLSDNTTSNCSIWGLNQPPFNNQPTLCKQSYATATNINYTKITRISRLLTATLPHKTHRQLETHCFLLHAHKQAAKPVSIFQHLNIVINISPFNVN